MGLGPHIYDAAFYLHDIKLSSSDKGVDFELADEDSSSSPQYYMYISSFGSWVLMKVTAVLTVNQYRYAAGSGNILTATQAFAARATTLQYYTFNQMVANLQ